jgi:hypothetical protein
MYYIVQQNLFREEGHAKLINCLERFEIPYELIDIKPFIEEIEFKTDRTDVFCFGSLKMARLSKQYGWNPGALITENHDYEVYSKYYKENLLNYDSRIFKVSEDFEWTRDEYFIRPCLDSKVFTGKIFSKFDWENTQHGLLNSGHITSLTPDTLIQVATYKNITQEVRCWVVDGKIVTQSTYRRGSFLYYSEIVDQDAIDFAQSMVDIFQLAKCFVIDVGLTPNGWKIIECGSISCAGFYDANMQTLIMALEDAYNSEQYNPSVDGLYISKCWKESINKHKHKK